MNNLSPPAISNEMLYEFLKEFEAEMREFKTDVNRRFEQMDIRIHRLEQKIDYIYETHHEIKVCFNWRFAVASAAISLGISILVVFLAINLF
jgi:DNA primase large subunit